MDWIARKKTFYSRITGCVLVLATAAWIFPPDVAAHSLFIQSGRHQVSEGKVSPLFFCYGHHFPVDDAIQRKKLAYVRVTAPDMTTTELTLREESSLHSYLINYEQSGTYILTAESTPGYFAMYTDKKGRERHSLKPLSSFADEAQKVHASIRSSQWAKAYVFSGKPSDPAPGPVGLPLELVPAANLAELKPGETLAFQVYSNKEPCTREGVWDATYAGFSTEAEDMYIQQTKTADGSFVLPVDHSGRWFVRFSHKTPAPVNAQGEYFTEKATTTFVFEVRGERKRPKVARED
ncbi:MAG: DUF4198 domain-containing protein [Desulfobulbaceae bacterium]|nr:DUF4198 domain-containing protein [Desulfobulbaceae bacterium]